MINKQRITLTQIQSISLSMLKTNDYFTSSQVACGAPLLNRKSFRQDVASLLICADILDCDITKISDGLTSEGHIDAMGLVNSLCEG